MGVGVGATVKSAGGRWAGGGTGRGGGTQPNHYPAARGGHAYRILQEGLGRAGMIPGTVLLDTSPAALALLGLPPCRADMVQPVEFDGSVPMSQASAPDGQRL